MEKISDRLYNWASVYDEETILQASRTARLPIVVGHVALMSDCHFGLGATVGSVVPTKGAIIPSCIGVDQGCGVAAVRLDVKESQLPDSLDGLLTRIEATIPAGVGKGHDQRSLKADKWMRANSPKSKFSQDQSAKALKQFGTLGSGNHFVEICIDENSDVWIMLHSGSRGIGNNLAVGHIKTAKKLARDALISLEDPDLAYFLEGTPEFDAYIADMIWAQSYARANRDQMMDQAFKETVASIGFGKELERINVHHNYTQREIHDGVELWITRKGAVKAALGDMSILPGSMGTGSFIVRGLGNPLSWNSAPHGAGRKMSRGEAKRRFTQEDLELAMKDKAWNANRASSLIDEIPASYKDVSQVLKDSADLVEVVHTLTQRLNYKGV